MLIVGVMWRKERVPYKFYIVNQYKTPIKKDENLY